MQHEQGAAVAVEERPLTRFSLDDILITPELDSRAGRAPNFAAENASLVRLSQEMARDPRRLLQSLVNAALQLCHAESAGISLIETNADGEHFRWAALAGQVAPYVGGTTPRDFSPCGVCLERDAPQLYAQAHRYFTYFADAGVVIAEGLVIPFYGVDRPLGTIWIVAHREHRHFDREDVRIMTSLGAFTAAALQLSMAADQAQEAAETAQDAVQVRDRFISVAAHELRTPLTSLLGNIELMERRAQRDGELSERNQRALQVAIAQANRLQRMIGSLLDLSRMQTGHFSIQRVLFDLAELVQRAVEEAQVTLDRHTLTCTIAAAPVLIEGDELRLEQVLQNLIGNAAKYSPEGGVIAVSLNLEGAQAHMTVVDHGIGIPEAELPRLFQQFYRASNADEQRIGGIGIGLAVVHEIVTLHGGTVEVASRVGAGSTFTVRLFTAPSQAAHP